METHTIERVKSIKMQDAEFQHKPRNYKTLKILELKNTINEIKNQ